MGAETTARSLGGKKEVPEMSARIRLVMPVATGIWNEPTRAELSKVAAPGTQLEVVNLSTGPVALESEWEVALVAPAVVDEVRRAEGEGCSGAVVYCFLDPGVRAAKEVVSIPVVGLMEAGLLLAGAVAERYGILNPVSRDYSATWSAALRYHGNRLVSIRALDMPVLELQDQPKMVQVAREVARKMVFEDRADAIVLGCGAMLGLDEEIQASLGIPVIAPGKAALKLVEALAGMGIAQSKRSFPEPVYNEVVSG